MRFLLTAISLFFILSYTKADDIHLKNGHVFMNVQVTDTTSNEVAFVKQNVNGSNKQLLSQTINKKEILSIFYKELTGESSKEIDWMIDDLKLNTQLQSIMPNATLVGFETRRPNLAIGLPLGILSLAGGIVVISNASADEKNLVLAGAIESVLGIYLVAIAFQTENWAIYSNGAEIKVTLKID